jgi:hypothetical protein
MTSTWNISCKQPGRPSVKPITHSVRSHRNSEAVADVNQVIGQN